MRPVTIRAVVGLLGLIAAAGLGAAVHGQPAERTIDIAVKKFAYQPETITLRKGEPVRLALTSWDRLHGFRQAELGIRADVKPDQTVVVRITPARAGTYVFACDVFCGDDHEEMQGTIIVTE